MIVFEDNKRCGYEIENEEVSRKRLLKQFAESYFGIKLGNLGNFGNCCHYIDI